jgi:hypothetical protein
MGLAADCRVDHGARSSSGRAQLETDALLFKGDFRLKIPLRDIRRLSTQDGRLEVRFGSETAVFHLGAAAERWGDKIRNPPSVLDKLGLKADMKVSVAGTVADPALLAAIEARAGDVAVGRPRAASDVIVFFAAAVTDLSRLETLRRSIVPAGAIWVVWPKGQPALKEDHVRAAALEVDLVDVKVASVSPVLSGLKLMIPRAHRPRSGRPE